MAQCRYLILQSNKYDGEWLLSVFCFAVKKLDFYLIMWYNIYRKRKEDKCTMTVEERVELLENKFNELVELVKFMVQVDNGVNANNADIILSNLDEIKEGL